MATPNIKFGTSGWRAVIAEDFNVSTLRRVTHAAAEHVKEHREYGYKGEEYLLYLRKAGKPAPKTAKIIIGYDTRYMSEDFAKNVAEAVAAEGIGLGEHYGCLVSSWSFAKGHLSDGFDTPNALSMRDRSFNLYVNERYGEQEVRDVVAAIAKVEAWYRR